MARGRRQRTGPPGPVRTCVVCRQRQPRDHLLRLVADDQGRIRFDPDGGHPGRGAWVCAEHLSSLDGRPGPLHRTLRRKRLHADGLAAATDAVLVAQILARLPACHHAGLVASGRAAVEAALASGTVGGQPLLAVLVAGRFPLPAAERCPLAARLPVDAATLGAAMGRGPRATAALGAGRPTRDLLRWLRFHAHLGYAAS